MRTKETAISIQQGGHPHSLRNSPRSRFVDRLDPRLVRALTVCGFGIPALIYACFVLFWSVNVVVSDQWADVSVIEASYSHFPDWQSLWLQHNENRVFFPNLVVLVLSRSVQFNIRIEEVLGVAFLFASVALIVWAHKRRSPGLPWLYYTPVPILMFSLVQWQNSLWGFQIAWYMVLFAFALAIYLLDGNRLGYPTLAGAVAAGVFGSFSSLQGLLIWPIGLFLLFHRRRPWQQVVVWVVSGIATAVLYFRNFNTSEGSPDHRLPLQIPLAALKFFLFLLGDILGFQMNEYRPHTNVFVLAFGLVMLLLSLVVIVLYGIRRDDFGGGPIGIALVLMGLGFALLTMEGRLIFGYWGASASRYTTFDLLVPVGIFLAVLDRPSLWGRKWDPEARRVATGAAVDPRETTDPRPDEPGWVAGWMLPLLRGVILALMVLQALVGLPEGLTGATWYHKYDVNAVRVLGHIDQEPDAAIARYLGLLVPPAIIRSRAHVLQQHRLSLFANSRTDGFPVDDGSLHRRL